MTVKRKCQGCGQMMYFDGYNFDGVALLKDSQYYHTTCLTELAAKRVQRKNHALYWDFAFEHIDICEKNARDVLSTQAYQDELNEHLLNNYNIIEVPKSFWSTVNDLGNGNYRRKKCKPVSMETMCGAWKWGQRNLDNIARNNKANKKGPKDDAQRLNYDLAILIQKIPLYLKDKAKREAEEIERLEKQKNEVKINYNNIAHTQAPTGGGIDDISSLLDDIFD